MVMNALQKLKNNVSGEVNGVVTIIVVIAMLVIGVFIVASFQGSIPSIADPLANQTATNIFNAGWNALGLLVVLPIVVAAIIIIGYLMRGFGGGGR